MASHTFAGRILEPTGPRPGWVQVADGRVIAAGEDDPPERPAAAGWIVPAPTNAHTHVADTFLRDAPGKPESVAALFGPGGWKHQQLARAGRDPAGQRQIAEGIERNAQEMAAIGTSHFIDFREGGLAGIRLLQDLAEALPVRPVIFGRPATDGRDEREMEAVVAAADGIGLPGMRDHPRAVLEAWAEACHDARKPFAVHVSEDRRDDMDAVLALAPAFVVHMTHGSRSDLQDLADEGVPIVVCPRSNAHFGNKPPVPTMVAAGCTVAVGTDNGMLQDGDLLEELALLRAWWPDLPMAELLAAATHNGRRVAGLPPVALRPGAAADLVVLPDDPLPSGPRVRPTIAPREAP